MKHRRLGLAGAPTIVVMCLTACSTSAPAAVPGGSIDPAAAVRVAPPLAVRTSGCSLIESIGTGFAIGDGLVVTVAHLVRGSTGVTVDQVPARVLALDLRSDVAVVDVGDAPGAAGNTVVFATPAVGERAVAVVRRDHATVAMPGTVSRTPRIKFEEPMDHTFYERQGLFLDQVTIVKGDSGAPVINADGEVIGMIFATSRQSARAYAVSASEITALLPAPGAPTVDTGSC